MYHGYDLNDMAKERLDEIHKRADQIRRMNAIRRAQREQPGQRTLFAQVQSMFSTVMRMFRRQQPAAPAKKRAYSTQELKAMR